MIHVTTRQIPLMAHPTTGSDAIRGVDAQVCAPSQGFLALAFTLRADMDRIRVGSEVTPGPADELWKHTCFEAFIQPVGSRGYYEFNFSPTRQWAVYRFASYREGMTPMHLAKPPDISVRKAAAQL